MAAPSRTARCGSGPVCASWTSIALTPGNSQVSAAIMIENQAVPARSSLWSEVAKIVGSDLKLWKNRNRAVRAIVARIALSGARRRSLTSPNHSGTWRSRLHASCMRLMKLM